jgi:xanthine/uracil permease
MVRVANLGIAAIVIGSLLLVAVVLLTFAPGQRRRRTRILAGLVPGIVGAAVVAALSADVVPDDLETVALPWVIIAVTIGLAALTIRHLAAD